MSDKATPEPGAVYIRIKDLGEEKVAIKVVPPVHEWDTTCLSPAQQLALIALGEMYSAGDIVKPAKEEEPGLVAVEVRSFDCGDN